MKQTLISSCDDALEELLNLVVLRLKAVPSLCAN